MTFLSFLGVPKKNILDTRHCQILNKKIACQLFVPSTREFLTSAFGARGLCEKVAVLRCLPSNQFFFLPWGGASNGSSHCLPIPTRHPSTCPLRRWRMPCLRRHPWCRCVWPRPPLGQTWQSTWYHWGSGWCIISLHGPTSWRNYLASIWTLDTWWNFTYCCGCCLGRHYDLWPWSIRIYSISK